MKYSYCAENLLIFSAVYNIIGLVGLFREMGKFKELSDNNIFGYS